MPKTLLICFVFTIFSILSARGGIMRNSMALQNDSTTTEQTDSAALEPLGNMLPEVMVFAQNKQKIEIKINKPDILVTQKCPQGFNVLGLIAMAAEKIFKFKHKETRAERAKRICESY